MSDSDPQEKWDRILAAVKASRAATPDEPAADSRPPTGFSATLVGRLRLFNASLAAWQRWALISGLLSILLFIASLIYLRSTSRPAPQTPIINVPSLELPEPPAANPDR